jgi:hypothetical protein
LQDRKCLCAACPAVVLRLKLIQVSDVREVDINLLLGLLLVAFCALVDNDFVNEGVQDFRRQFGNPGELFCKSNEYFL